MDINHPWVKTIAEAKQIQQELQPKAIATDCLGEVKYVSIGHKISLPTAIDYVMGCLTKYRLPETTRWADKLASSKK